MFWRERTVPSPGFANKNRGVSRASQAKLLRVLESGEVKPVGVTRPFHVDVRVVTTTHQPRANGASGRSSRGSRGRRRCRSSSPAAA
jgi:hypothetical protein